MAIPEQWLRGIQEWAERNGSVREVWLFGSRQHGDEKEDSDLDLAITLMPPNDNHDWALGNYTALGDDWQRELAQIVGRPVDLTLLSPEISPQPHLLWRREC